MIAGDLFDGVERSARTVAFLVEQLDKLREKNIRVFYIKGNHDAENPITNNLTVPDNVHIFDGRGGKVQLNENIWIHGVSFAKRQAPESLLSKFSTPIVGAVNIAMLHTSLAGAAGHDVYAPCSVADLTTMGFDYWALGHVHRRQVHSKDPWIVMPGMPQGRDIGETGLKSATLLTVDGTIQVKEVPTSAVEFLPHTIDVTDIDSYDALRDRFRQELRELAEGLQSDTCVVRLTLSGASVLRWQILRDRDIWVGIVRQIAQETERLWLDKLVLELADSTAQGQGAMDDLAQLMETIRIESGFAETSRAELEAILAELPPQRRAALLPDEDAATKFSQRLAEMGGQRMIALMRGKSD